jgi:C1A family cysteine protease
MSKQRMGVMLFAPILTLLAAWPARSQGLVAQQAPLSPRYQSWLANHRPRGIPGPAGGPREGGMRVRGYTPPPVNLSHVKGPVFTHIAGMPTYPSDYDLRATGMLTPVKDQGEYGTCWCFACIGAMESSMLMADLGVFDLAEWYPAYFGYHPFSTFMTAFTAQPLPPGDDPIFDQGGNDWMSTALLARGNGAVNEKACPYQPGGYRPEPRPAGDLPNGREDTSVPMEAALYLFNSDAEISAPDVKYALTHYGPAVISMDWEDQNFSDTYNTYRDTTATEFDLNHEVCIVGWNDTFEPCQFPANNRPAKPGAWIVRNSWSRYWGQGGYFYLSYDSKVFDGTVFVGGPRTSHRIHQYDPLGWVNNIGLGNPRAVCANIFHAEEAERITAVAFYTSAVGTYYQVDVRTGVTPGDPGSGASGAGGLGPQQGDFDAPGYHIVTLDHPVTVAADSDFAVLAGLETPGYNYPIPVQEMEPGYSDSATSQRGRSFISPDGATWQDLSPDCQGAVVCLKALAEKVD